MLAKYQREEDLTLHLQDVKLQVEAVWDLSTLRHRHRELLLHVDDNTVTHVLCSTSE